MKKESNRDLLVMLKSQFINEQAFEQEVECINSILVVAEQPASFCLAHELVYRNRITQKPSKILKACRQYYLPAFYFLINKN